MKINVIFNPAAFEELYFTGKTTVVIDAMRATATIVTAFMNGVREIVPVNTVEFAMKASASMFGGQTLLAGERNTKKIDGFNLGNSPSEFTSEVIAGKSVVLFTSNGTKAIARSKFSDLSIICSFLNLSAVAKFVAVPDSASLEIMCSGRNNSFSMEDAVCAGKLILEISSILPTIELSDSAKASVQLAKSTGKQIKKMMFESDHGQLLIENGFTDDIVYCSKLNITDIVPVFTSNIIKLATLQKPLENNPEQKDV